MKRNAREAELMQAAETAFRLGGMEAVYRLSTEKRRNLPCPLCHGGKVIKTTEIVSYYAVDGSRHQSPGMTRVEQCGGCEGEGKVRVSLARAMQDMLVRR